MRNLLFTFVIACALVSGVAYANHDIAEPYTADEMTITVDGDLSDWAGASWKACNETYHGVTTDASGQYALAWNSTTNRLYVAVDVTDTEQNFASDYLAWNGQDGIELYVDAEIDTSVYYVYHDVGQQVMTGTDGAGGTWTKQIVGGNTEEAVVVESMVAVVNGDNVIYEYCIMPYAYYTGFGGTVEAADRMAVLAADQTIGFDLVVSTLNDSSEFGMLCNNTTGGKHSRTENFQLWTLASGSAPHPGDIDNNGVVNLDDFIILKQNYGVSPATWSQGDMNDDDVVNLDDFIILKQNYGWAELQ